MDVYVDKEYKTLKFFEHWMEFIASGTHNPIDVPPEYAKPVVALSRKNYNYRMQYPNQYKCDRTKIVKFNRDYNLANEVEYTYLGLFPSSMSSIQVNYEAASIMTVSVTFTYDRYYAGNPDSLAEATKTDNNKKSSQQGVKFPDKLVNLDTDTITRLYKNSDKTNFGINGQVPTNTDYSKAFESKSSQSSSSTFRIT